MRRPAPSRASAREAAKDLRSLGLIEGRVLGAFASRRFSAAFGRGSRLAPAALAVLGPRPQSGGRGPRAESGTRGKFRVRALDGALTPPATLPPAAARGARRGSAEVM